MTPSPPLTALADLSHQLAGSGYAVLGADDVLRLSGNSAAQMQAWLPLWHDLPPDLYLKDGGRYRRRRHSSFVIEGDQVQLAPHRAHWQSVSYNALHGGIERWFEPLPAALVADPAWTRLLRALAATASALRGPQTWYLEAHSFRIGTEGGIGRPTPEGAHRDGVDLVAVMLMARVGIKGAETRVFDARGPQGVRFTLTQPYSTLLLDDERVVHESTPIQPLGSGQSAYRDTLVLTLRRGSFQDP